MQITANAIYLALFLASANFAQAAPGPTNATDQPCVWGACTWRGGDNINSLYSAITINGTQELIGDVTPAAGWIMQGCDPNWTSGTSAVQLICSGSQNQTQHCNRLFDGGAENTIVRLPDNCGKGPFARVISMNESSGVHTMEMDYHLSQIPPSRGKIDFSLTLGDGFSLASNASGVVKKRESISSDPIPFSFQKSGTLYSKSLSCTVGESSAELGFQVDGSGDLSGTIVFGGSISGSILPPEIDGFALTTTLSASGSIDFDLDASLKIGTSTGKVPFASVGIPGLDIPGLISIGPSLDVDTKVDIDVELQAKASINAQLNLNNIQLVLPSSAGSSSANVSPSSSNPVQLNINPSVFASASVIGHVIPRLSLSISAFEGFASASVFLESDLGASVTVDVQTFNKREHPRSFTKRRTAACVSVDAFAAIDAGVSGSLGPLKDGDSITLFSETTQLYSNCLTIAGTSKREPFNEVFRRQDELQCPSPSDIASDLENVL